MNRLVNLLENYSPGPLEVVIFAVGVCCLLASTGAVKSVSLPWFSIPLPSKKKWKLALFAMGIGAFFWSTVVTLEKPVWKQAVSEEPVYQGKGEAAASQIVADGERLFVLTKNGNILRILDNGTGTVDLGTNTARIAAAGGLLYVLKNSGRIWGVFLSEEQAEYKQIDEG